MVLQFSPVLLTEWVELAVVHGPRPSHHSDLSARGNTGPPTHHGNSGPYVPSLVVSVAHGGRRHDHADPCRGGSHRADPSIHGLEVGQAPGSTVLGMAAAAVEVDLRPRVRSAPGQILDASNKVAAKSHSHCLHYLTLHYITY